MISTTDLHPGTREVALRAPMGPEYGGLIGIESFGKGPRFKFRAQSSRVKALNPKL